MASCHCGRGQRCGQHGIAEPEGALHRIIASLHPDTGWNLNRLWVPCNRACNCIRRRCGCVTWDPSDHLLRGVMDDVHCRIGGYRLLLQKGRVAETVDEIDDEVEIANGKTIELVTTADVGMGSGYGDSDKPAVFGQAV